jgi:hypothetical protein
MTARKTAEIFEVFEKDWPSKLLAPKNLLDIWRNKYSQIQIVTTNYAQTLNNYSDLSPKQRCLSKKLLYPQKAKRFPDSLF